MVNEKTVMTVSTHHENKIRIRNIFFPYKINNLFVIQLFDESTINSILRMFLIKIILISFYSFVVAA